MSLFLHSLKYITNVTSLKKNIITIEDNHLYNKR